MGGAKKDETRQFGTEVCTWGASTTGALPVEEETGLVVNIGTEVASEVTEGARDVMVEACLPCLKRV